MSVDIPVTNDKFTSKMEFVLPYEICGQFINMVVGGLESTISQISDTENEIYAKTPQFVDGQMVFGPEVNYIPKVNIESTETVSPGVVKLVMNLNIERQIESQ